MKLNPQVNRELSFTTPLDVPSEALASDRLDLLMERLRIQSIIQRLKKRHGEDHALKIIQQAIELEFGLNKQHEQTQQTRVGNTHRSPHLDSN